MLPLLKYTVLRLALFVAVFGLLALLGAGPLLAVIGAALVSAMLSYLLLQRQRNEVTAQIAERVEARAARRGPSLIEQDEAFEDAATDGGRTSGPDPEPGRDRGRDRGPDRGPDRDQPA